ncbi:MAG: hypothetical protein FWH20_10470 [Oscillospiraceae bacterium]|nr:hypothetical protein [Oscillospiraceae bacterium]
MRSSFAGLETSKRTIQVSQKSLDIAVNNQSNISTQGYTRQRIDTNALYITTYKNWQTKQARLSLAGQGVSAFGVSQVRNFYLDKRFREMNSQVSEYATKEPILHEIQTMLDVYENVGMDGKLAIFKRALQEYAADNADNAELASIVRNSAQDIARMLNTYARDLDKLLDDNIFELGETVKNTNTILEKISALNKAIVKEYKATEFNMVHAGTGVSPYGPLELLDSRNLLLDELSGLTNMKVEENSDGSINVYIGDVMMVDGKAEKFEQLVLRDFNNFNASLISASNGKDLSFKSGEIKARLDMINGNGPYANSFQGSGYGIPYYRHAVDAFAETFANLLNSTNGVFEGDSSRAMFASSLDVYDSAGNLVERGAITAATIRISDEWMLDAMMIGRIHSIDIVGTTRLNLNNLPLATDPPASVPIDHTVNITIGGVTREISFRAATSSGVTTNNFNAALATAFGLDPDIPYITMSGLLQGNIPPREVSTDSTLVAGGSLDFDALAPTGADNTMTMTIGGQTITVTFETGANTADTIANLNQAIRDAAGNLPDTANVFTATGAMRASIGGGILEARTATGGTPLAVERFFIGNEELRESASTNLDGNNVHKLMLALDERVRFGNVRDFEGTQFDYIAFLTNRIGQGLSFIEEQYDTALVTVNNLLDSRDAVSGVSTDEEGINMLVYQKWYNAAARMMTALDDLLDRIINGMGRVGL